MKTISVKAVKREEYGKKAAKAVRREGMVPCVLSGHGESVAFSVDPREIKPLIYIRIMAGTNRIDVQLFHDSDILNHALYTYHISTIRIYLMPYSVLCGYNQQAFVGNDIADNV